MQVLNNLSETKHTAVTKVIVGISIGQQDDTNAAIARHEW